MRPAPQPASARRRVAPPPAAEGSPEPAAATPPPLPSREATAPIDSGATMAFGMPAYLAEIGRAHV